MNNVTNFDKYINDMEKMSKALQALCELKNAPEAIVDITNRVESCVELLPPKKVYRVRGGNANGDFIVTLSFYNDKGPMVYDTMAYHFGLTERSGAGTLVNTTTHNDVIKTLIFCDDQIFDRNFCMKERGKLDTIVESEGMVFINCERVSDNDRAKFPVIASMIDEMRAG